MNCLYCSSPPVTTLKIKDRLYSNSRYAISVCRNHINEALDMEWQDYWDKEDIFEWWRDDKK